MSGPRIGVVGLGRFGDIHSRIWNEMPQAELVAVCSRDADRARAVAEAHGAPKWYTDYEDMARDPDIDAIDICNELARHTEVGLAALSEGKHVLCEILHALTLEETSQLMASAQEHHAHYMVGFIERFDVRRALAKQKIDAGELGSLVSMYVRRNVWRGFLDVPRDQPYPLILQPGILSIDQLLWLGGSRVREVYARTRSLSNPAKADAWWIMLTFENGLVGVIEQSWFMPDIRLLWCDVHFEAVGTQATYQFHEPNDSNWLWTPEVTRHSDFYLLSELHGRATGALANQLAYFAEHIAAGQTPAIGTLAEAYEALRVGLAITESAACGRAIQL